MGSWRTQLAQGGRSMGQPKEVIVPAQLPADTVLIRLPNPLESDGDTRLVSGVGTSIGCLPIRAYEGGHSNSCRVKPAIAEGQKSAAGGAASRHLEHRGKRGEIVFPSPTDGRLNWHAIWLGDSSAFWRFIDSPYACILRSLCALSVVRDGKTPSARFCEADRDGTPLC